MTVQVSESDKRLAAELLELRARDERIAELERERDEARRERNEAAGLWQLYIGQRDEARKFGEDAARKYNDLLKTGPTLTCAFCGEAYPNGTPPTQHEALTAHIQVCPKHPMRALEAENARLSKRVEQLEAGGYDTGFDEGWMARDRRAKSDASAAARRDEQGEAAPSSRTPSGSLPDGARPAIEANVSKKVRAEGTAPPRSSDGEPSGEARSPSEQAASPYPAPQATRETDPSPAAGSARGWSEQQREAARLIASAFLGYDGGPYAAKLVTLTHHDNVCAEIAKHAHLFAAPAPVAVTRERIKKVLFDAADARFRAGPSAAAGTTHEDALADAVLSALSAPVSAEALERACKQAYLSRPFARSWEHDADRMARIGEARALLKQLGIATEGA